jgi:hypothetical protein
MNLIYYEVPDDIKEICTNLSINVLDFNNLDYFYNYIESTSEELNPILRFILSRFGRVLKNNKWNLVAMNIEDIKSKVENLMSSTQKNYRLIVDRVSTDYNLTGSTLEIINSIYINKLSKKEYKVKLIIKYNTYA